MRAASLHREKVLFIARTPEALRCLAWANDQSTISLLSIRTTAVKTTILSLTVWTRVKSPTIQELRIVACNAKNLTNNCWVDKNLRCLTVQQ